MLLRFDTPHPLDKPEKIEKLMKVMLKTAKVLECKPDEMKMLKAEVAKSDSGDVEPDVEDKDIEQGAGIESEGEGSGASEE